jgi:hypothetical protein
MSAATVSAPKTENLTKTQRSQMPELDTPALSDSTPRSDNEAIARLAYGYWEEWMRNNISKSADEDWYRAEEELGV